MDEVITAYRDYPIIEVQGHRFSGVRDRTLYEKLTKPPITPIWISLTYFLAYALALCILDTTVRDPDLRKRFALVAQPTTVLLPWFFLLYFRSPRRGDEAVQLSRDSDNPRRSSSPSIQFNVTIVVSHTWWGPEFRDKGWFGRDGGELKFRGVFSTFAVSSAQILKIKLGNGSLEFKVFGGDDLTKGTVKLQLNEPTSPALTLLQEEFRLARHEIPTTEPVFPALLELGPKLTSKQSVRASTSVAFLLGLVLYSIFVFSRLKGALMDESLRFIAGAAGIMLILVAAVITLLWVQETKRRALERLLEEESTITHLQA